MSWIYFVARHIRWLIFLHVPVCEFLLRKPAPLPPAHLSAVFADKGAMAHMADSSTVSSSSLYLRNSMQQTEFKPCFRVKWLGIAYLPPNIPPTLYFPIRPEPETCFNISKAEISTSTFFCSEWINKISRMTTENGIFSPMNLEAKIYQILNLTFESLQINPCTGVQFLES